MSLLTEVLRETAAGATPPVVAARLGVDVALVVTVLDHAERLGLVHRPGCVGCDLGPACVGCPVAPR